jgi:hypothetical protein
MGGGPGYDDREDVVKLRDSGVPWGSRGSLVVMMNRSKVVKKVG